MIAFSVPTACRRATARGAARIPFRVSGVGRASLALLLGAVITLAVPRGHAQDAPAAPTTPAPLVVDPDSAAALAVKNSIQLQIDAQTVAEAEAQLKQAWAMNGVSADASVAGLYQGPKPPLPADFSSFFVTLSHSETLSASKPLWLGGKLEAALDQARTGLKLARTSAEVTRLALAKMARDAVLKLGLDERLEAVDYATLAGLMEHERVSDKRYREGLVAFFEVAQAQAQVAAQQRIIAEKGQDIVKDRTLLCRILNVPQTTPIEVGVGRFPERPKGQLDEVIAYALDHRPEMNRARRGVELAEATVRATRRGLRPNVVVSAQVQNQTASVLSAGVSYQVVLAFQQPIWDGGQKNAQVKQQLARLQESQRAMEQMAVQVAQEVAEQYLQLDLLQKRIAAAEVEERAALEQLRIARLRFQEDLGLGEEAITAQAAVSRAQNARANAESDLQTAISRLRAAMGMADLQEATPQ